MDLAPSTLINHLRKRQFEYSNSLTRPELLPVAVFYGKTQLENEQTPPDRRPGGPQLPLPPRAGGRGGRPYNVVRQGGSDVGSRRCGGCCCNTAPYVHRHVGGVNHPFCTKSCTRSARKLSQCPYRCQVKSA